MINAAASAATVNPCLICPALPYPSASQISACDRVTVPLPARYDPTLKAWQRRVFSRTALPQRFAVVMRQGQACAYGYSTQQGDILNLNDLWVRADLRAQGIGTQLIHGLMQRGKAEGAKIACITVNESNAGARRLYARLGFVRRYRYSYWELSI